MLAAHGSCIRMPRTYVDHAMNRRLGRVGMPHGSAMYNKSTGCLYTRTYVDNDMNRRLGRVGLLVGTAVQSKGSSSLTYCDFSDYYDFFDSDVRKTDVDDDTSQRLGRVAVPDRTAVQSKEPPNPSHRTYVDNDMNRRLGRVGLPVGTAVHSKGSSSLSYKTYVDNDMNRRLGRVGLPVGTAVHSKGSPSLSYRNESPSPDSDSDSCYPKTNIDNPKNKRSDRFGLPVGKAALRTEAGSPVRTSSDSCSPTPYVDNPMNRRLGRVGLPTGTAVHSKEASSPVPSSNRTYVDNDMNRRLGRVGLPVGTAVHSKGSSSLSYRTYVDNDMNRRLGRVGLPVGTAVHSKGSSSLSYRNESPSPDSDSDSCYPKTNVDNPKNKRSDRFGLPVGKAALSTEAASPVRTRSDSCSPTLYGDNPMNRRLGRVGLPTWTAVHSKEASSPVPSSNRAYNDKPLNREKKPDGPYGGAPVCNKGTLLLPHNRASQLKEKVYADNAFNQKHNRVGWSLGSKPVRKSDLCYKDNPLNRSLHRVGLPLGSQKQKKKKHAALRKLLLNIENCNEESQCNEDDSDFHDVATAMSFYDSSDQRFINDLDHVMENLNRGQEEDIWMELERKPFRSPSRSSGCRNLFTSKTRFEDLELKQKIGHGGFGDVYFAVHHKEVVAVKILKQRNVSQIRLEMFEREITLHSHMNHLNIVRIHGPWWTRSILGFVMEYMDASLWESIHINEVDFLVSHKLQILQSITSGLAYLHGIPFIHGDLKTQNVLLLNVPGSRTFDCNQPVIAKLSDFGLSLLKSDMETSQSVKMACEGATLCYSAPEVIRGEQLNTSDCLKADIYSMGLLILEMATEQTPFEDHTFPQLYHQVGILGTKPAVSLGPMLDEDLENILNQCWDFDPKKRPNPMQLKQIASTVDKIWMEEE